MSRPIPILVVIVWIGCMAALVQRTYGESSGNLATDLARYGSTAQWRGVYYRGEKIGFTVSQTLPAKDDAGALDLQEDGQLQMSLLGSHTVTTLRTTARVNRAFELQSFVFSLDPGTGPITVAGDVRDLTLDLSITSNGQTRSETMRLAERPMLAMNLVRRLADRGLTPGARYEWKVFDPATLRNAPVTVTVGEREVVRADGRPMPAFRVEMEFAGLRTTSWITDTGEMVREESPLGFISVRENSETARALAVPGRIRQDLLEAAAVVPQLTPGLPPIADPRDVRRVKMQVEGIDLSSADLVGAGQRVEKGIIEIEDALAIDATAVREDLARYLAPEPFIESDDEGIRTAAEEAVRGVTGSRAQAEALTRYVSATVQKKPTVSLPSAREVLRTKIGDCNEHTALFVAMARAIGIPARIAVGLAYVRGAFYYHAWPEVYLDEGSGRGRWLPVDPTFNQFPADATHLRLVRGGLDRQATILPLIGRLKITMLDIEVRPGSTPTLVGQAVAGAPIALPTPRDTRRWCLPCFLGGHE